mmetsp:Transcript_996/g.6222  ORF Transcript_996/g.6222 Transcript_996/m.6222 type:complete len:244 (-) Transcript_996:1177-1908(-)
MASPSAASAWRGRCAVVTGASRGIGLEMARQLLDGGAHVVAAVRRPEKCDALRGYGERITWTKLDVSKEDSVAEWAHDLSQNKKIEHVDLLVNNAGVYGRRVDLDSVKTEDMLHTFITNTVGPLLVVQQLRKQGLIGGSKPTLVGNVTSKVGSVADNGSGGGYAYRASKCALNVVNKSMSIDLHDENIRCVLLHPGYVRTDMTGGNGLIDTETSAAGLLQILARDPEEINARFFDYKQEEIPW